MVDELAWSLLAMSVVSPNLGGEEAEVLSTPRLISVVGFERPL
jgi:hypothetical protein